jgi:hypothetical protein
MQKCLIAPIRAEHVASAFGRAEHMGQVQFGSNDLGLFEKLRKDGQVGEPPVYLFPTKHKVAGTQPTPGRCFMRGILSAVSTTPSPELRPDAASSDNDFEIYWTVAEVTTTGDLTELGDFITSTEKPHATTPRRPIIARIAEKD